jgi:hypothetical protein
MIYFILAFELTAVALPIANGRRPFPPLYTECPYGDLGRGRNATAKQAIGRPPDPVGLFLADRNVEPRRWRDWPAFIGQASVPLLQDGPPGLTDRLCDHREPGELPCERSRSP